MVTELTLACCAIPSSASAPVQIQTAPLIGSHVDIHCNITFNPVIAKNGKAFLYILPFFFRYGRRINREGFNRELIPDQVARSFLSVVACYILIYQNILALVFNSNFSDCYTAVRQMLRKLVNRSLWADINIRSFYSLKNSPFAILSAFVGEIWITG